MQQHRWSKLNAGWVGMLAAVALAACDGTADDAATSPGPGSERAGGEEKAIPVMGPERRIIAFGDSLFAGYGLKDAAGDSYPARLEAALRARGVNARIVNAGISGDTTAAGLQRLGFLLGEQKQKPDLFILELGANDMLRGLPPTEARANLAKMLDELQQRDIPVLLMGMRAPPNYGPEYQKEFDAIYGDLAKQYGAGLIPFWLESIYQDQSLFLDDRIHPTEEGIEQLVSATVDEVAKALPEDTKGG